MISGLLQGRIFCFLSAFLCWLIRKRSSLLLFMLALWLFPGLALLTEMLLLHLATLLFSIAHNGCSSLQLCILSHGNPQLLNVSEW
jgi:hypothetical protein